MAADNSGLPADGHVCRRIDFSDVVVAATQCSDGDFML